MDRHCKDCAYYAKGYQCKNRRMAEIKEGWSLHVFDHRGYWHVYGMYDCSLWTPHIQLGPPAPAGTPEGGDKCR